MTPLVMQLTMPFYPIVSTYESRRLYPMEPPERAEAYVLALRREAEASAADYRDCRVSAVSVSGGIAGHAADELLGELLRDLHRWYVFADDTEVTLNVHPGMVSAETLDACRRGRVTRLAVDYCTGDAFESEAIQRFLPPSAMDVTARILKGSKLLLSFDLITGLPGQSRESLRKTLEKVCAYGASEIVLHPFKLIPGTLFSEKEAPRLAVSRSPRKALPDAQQRDELMAFAGLWLEDHGFSRTLPAGEDGRTAFAISGLGSGYHQMISRGCAQLGFGCGAVTRMDGIEAFNTGDLDRYIQYSPDPLRIVETVREITE